MGVAIKVDADKKYFLNAVLYPHRSLTRAGFKWVMAVMTVMSAFLALTFWSMGAWPISLFMLISVGITYISLRANYRHGQERERICLTKHSLVLEHTCPRGRVKRWSFYPGRLNVWLHEDGEHHCKLHLSGREHSLEIGAFLPPDERAEVAGLIRAALEEWRRPRPPNHA